MSIYLDLLRDVAAAGGKPGGPVYVYAYLAVWKQDCGVGWADAKSYTTFEVRHTPGLASEVTSVARYLTEARLIELGPSGRRRAERPYVLTEAGRALLAEVDGDQQEPGSRPNSPGGAS